MSNAILKKIKAKQAAKEHGTLQQEGKNIIKIPLNKIKDNPFQPRIEMDQQKINELAQSIKNDGLLQPIPVIKNNDGTYTSIAGHRRREATKSLDKTEIEAHIIENVTDKELATLAIAENLQREQLNIIELAMQYKTLLTNGVFKSQRELAEAVGRNYAEISKTISALSLPEEVIEDIKQNQTIKDVKIISMLKKAGDKEDIEKTYEWIKEQRPKRQEIANKLKESSKKEDNQTDTISIKKIKIKLDKEITIQNIQDYNYNPKTQTLEIEQKDINNILKMLDMSNKTT